MTSDRCLERMCWIEFIVLSVFFIFQYNQFLYMTWTLNKGTLSMNIHRWTEWHKGNAIRACCRYSTTKSWTARTARAGWRRRPSTTPSPSWTRSPRSRTRTPRSSCSCCATTSRSGPPTCRATASPVRLCPAAGRPPPRGHSLIVFRSLYRSRWSRTEGTSTRRRRSGRVVIIFYVLFKYNKKNNYSIM